ncbi:hypothetical protein NPIL_520281 [Nephila pilipes]|uniref:Uncharacterized protein n=1 Tax=Nephila pilipes TaxID=299642 RepID=A0A8X6NC45_NEPPI|nr:hypothetical protein NPIL_520281 [Nephila pilipes]
MNGVGIYCEHFSHYLSLGTAEFVLDGEVEAIKMALIPLRARPLSDHPLRFTSCDSDSMSVMHCSSLMGKVREKYERIALQWIPSNCGIPGNGKADGCFVDQAPYNLVSYKSASSMINRTLKTMRMSSLKEKPGRNVDHSDCRRRIAIAAFRLATGHDCLHAHLYR